MTSIKVGGPNGCHNSIFSYHRSFTLTLYDKILKKLDVFFLTLNDRIAIEMIQTKLMGFYHLF